MRYIAINAILSTILTVQSFAADKENVDTNQFGVKVSSYFPEQFTVEQLKGLQELKLVDIQHGKLQLDDSNHKKLIATNPYRLQLLTGTWDKFANNIKIVPESLTIMNPGQVKAIYRFHSPYTKWNNADFEVMLNFTSIDLICVTASVLGDRDFLARPEQPISNSCFFYIANTDEQFIRDTPSSLHRFNVTMSNWLLILNQLKGYDIFSLAPEEREKLGQTLYNTYLIKKGLKLNSDGILTAEEYIKINDDLRMAILGHFGLMPRDIPTLDHITQTGRLEDMFKGKYYFAFARKPDNTMSEKSD